MHVLQPELSQTKRAAEDVQLTKHAYVRVHVHPKRFPAAYIVDWKVELVVAEPLYAVLQALPCQPDRSDLSQLMRCQERIVHTHEDYVLVNKPPGVPVVPPVDNILESCLACTAQVLLRTRLPINGAPAHLLRPPLALLLHLC